MRQAARVRWRSVYGVAWCVLGLLITAANSAVAADHEVLEDVHQARHGGHFGDADDLYHYEALLERPHRLILYVNDEHNQPLDVRPLTGRWTLDPDGSNPTTGAFRPEDSGRYFFADLPLSAGPEPIHVKVEVLKGDTWAAMEFFLPTPT